MFYYNPRTMFRNLAPILSTHLFVHRPLDGEAVGAAAEAGFAGVEIFAAPGHFPPGNPEGARRIHRLIQKAGLSLEALHAPFYASRNDLDAGRFFALGDRDGERRRAAQSAVASLLHLAADLGSPDVVLHGGHKSPAAWTPGILSASIERVLAAAPDYEGRILVENTPGAVPSPAAFAAAGAALDRRRAGLCLDVGHLFLGAGKGSRNLARIREAGGGPALLDLIEHVHAHDNGGGRDEHLPPGEGAVDWRRVVEDLSSAGRPIAFSLELRDVTGGGLPPRELLGGVLSRIKGPVLDLLKSRGIEP